MITREGNEPEEIIEARELLKEFEKSTGLSKKSSFSGGIRILNDFLAGHPNSGFSQRVNSLKNIYTKVFIKKLGVQSFSDLDDWVKTVGWIYREFSDDEIDKFKTDPEFEKDWRNFFEYFLELL